MSRARPSDSDIASRVSSILDFPSQESRAFLDAYPEMKWLTGNVNATPEGIAVSGTSSSLSRALFGAQHIEFDRTAVGVMVLKWIINDDYASFTSCQPEDSKLARESFEELRHYTTTVLGDDEAIDAMVAYMVINDLGKIKSIVDQVRDALERDEVDHDKVLLFALQDNKEIAKRFESFQRISKHYQTLILNGLKAEFNIGQFIQGENVAASLVGLTGLDKESLDFYLLHAILDIAGARGHLEQNGSMVMIEPTYQGYKMAVEAINKFQKEATPNQVYDDYLSKRAIGLGLGLEDPEQKALTRICCMLRIFDPANAIIVRETFKSLPTNTRSILVNELNRTGVDDGWATLIYYAPATLNNARDACKAERDDNALSKGLTDGLHALARTFQLATINTRNREGNGVYTVMGADLAEKAKTPQKLNSLEIILKPLGEDAVASLEKKNLIDARRFPRLKNLGDIPGERFAIIGIGGGSDGIQAAVIARLLETTGKTCPCVISVRTARTGSQISAGNIGEQRTVENHGGKIAEGVYSITSETTGSGRFLENIPAETIAVFLVIDNENGTVDSQISEVIKNVSGVDTIIAVDTGGDALYSAGGQDQTMATPDQDLRILKALKNLTIPTFTCEIACGVDSPANAETILLKAGSIFYKPTISETATILRTYQEWEMDGTNPKRFGKTVFAWQAALRGEEGYRCLPLPKTVVTDRRNPWDPYVYIDGSTSPAHEGIMPGIFVTELAKHLRAIGAA